jgi:peptidoglycan/LPS O-acetylase OafA/YrhL
MARDTPHRNNFGLLRLAFALLVIVSHSFELVTGDRSREPLTMLFGTLSFGELAVDGFFIVSGYLITQSFERSSSTTSYLWKRVLRIYPGFLVAYCLSVLVVAPLGGGDISILAGTDGLKTIRYALKLNSPPFALGAFSGSPYPVLNGSMWTIAYEFRCYLLVIPLGLLGLLRPRRALVTLPAVIVFLGILQTMELPGRLTGLIGTSVDTFHFTSVFIAGMFFSIFQKYIPMRNVLAAAAFVLFVILLFNHVTAHAAVGIFGSYLIFWFAFLPNTPSLARINNSIDLSYGIYLYAWPVQKLLIWFVAGISPWLVMFATVSISSILALISWTFVEKPALSLKDKTSRSPMMAGG